MSPDVAASVRARLLRVAHERSEEFEFVLTRFAIERFLYRLGVSAYADGCVLKGATLLGVWLDDPWRATRDVDLLRRGPSHGEAIRELVEAVAAVPCPEDGISFDTGGLEVSAIRPEDGYGGQRAVFLARLGSARIRVQVDFGFGDAVVPGPEPVRIPTWLPALPAPEVRGYPMVVSVAEKLEAMVQIGERNTRMKDFHDVWALASGFDFDGRELRRAVAACFERRGTSLGPPEPAALGAGFHTGAEMQRRWTAYLAAGALRQRPPGAFPEVGRVIREFLLPVREAILAGASFDLTWPAGGPWR